MTAAFPRAWTHARPEHLLLFAASRVPHAPALPDPQAQSFDWHYIHQAARRQGVAPLLYDWLTHHPLANLPDDLLARLRATYWSSHFCNRTLLEELTRVLAATQACGIAIMPLKGALLAARYYPAPALRPMSDLDLLVRPADFEALAVVLTQLGYRELLGPPSLLDERLQDRLGQERAFITERAGLPVLIEYRAEPLDPMAWHLTELDPELVRALRAHAARGWRRATARGWRHVTWHEPSAEDLLLHVACHLTTRHADFRLLWLHDLGRIVATQPALDWRYLAREARALRLAVPLFAALQATHRWLDAPVPLRHLHGLLFGVTRAPQPIQFVERVLLTQRLRALGHADLAAPPPSELAVQLGSLARLRGPRPRLRALRWLVAPGGTYAASWRGAGSAAGYGLTIGLRLLILALHALDAAGRRLALPLVSHLAQRTRGGVTRAARLDPFAEYQDRRPAPDGSSKARAAGRQ